MFSKTKIKTMILVFISLLHLVFIKTVICFYTIGSSIIDAFKTYMFYGFNINEMYILGCTQYQCDVVIQINKIVIMFLCYKLSRLINYCYILSFKFCNYVDRLAYKFGHIRQYTRRCSYRSNPQLWRCIDFNLRMRRYMRLRHMWTWQWLALKDE